jgi:DNA-binding response OmpR family regulator
MRKKPARYVLCIGGDPVTLNLRCALLRGNGWEAVSCSNGHEGIFRFAKGNIHVVVLDVDGDGSEAALIAGELKRQSPRIPIIMLVGKRETLVQGATDQADAVVPKPGEQSVLPARVREFLAPA